MNIPKKTKAAILYQTNRPLVIEELTLPELTEGQVLVKVATSGICFTQLLEARGKKGEDHFLPHTMGHEASGTVLSIGERVTRVQPNDHVVLSWIKGEGFNAPGPKYKNSEGRIVNAGPVATFCEYAVVSENRVTAIPKSMPAREAALLGCAIPTGAGILLNQLSVDRGKSVVVFGAGGVGLSALLAARHSGCHPIIAVDVTDDKLEFSKKFGASLVINAKKDDVLAKIRELTGGGADYIIESSGSKQAMEAAYEAVRDGGELVIAGNLARGEKISIDPYNLIRGKRLSGTVGGSSKPSEDIPKYARWFLEGTFPFGDLAQGTYKLEQINEALDCLERGALGRILLEL